MIEDLGNGVTLVRFPRRAFVKSKFWKDAAANYSSGEVIEGVKTFWPKHFKPTNIIQIGEEQLFNPDCLVKVKPGGSKVFETRLNNGLKIRGTLSPVGEINSIYPSFTQ